MVGLSLLTLVPGEVGGSETYARELIRSLAGRSRFEYRVFVPALLEGDDVAPAATVVRRYGGGVGTSARALAMARATLAPRRIRREMKLEELDVVHFPLTVQIPATRSVPTITSILDVQHEFFPEFFSRAERIYRRAIYARSARRSALIVAISEHVRGTLVEHLGVPPERVRVIYLGVDHEHFTPGSGARDPMLLYPANAWPHKNHERLLVAFARIRTQRPDLRLVLTGNGHDAWRSTPGVDVLGRASRDELARLYQRASALVFPSLYEGFGQPPLEAMASGCAVAASSAGALPEVCGDAACLFDPREPEDIARAVLEVVDDPAPFRTRGLARAESFSWDRCASEHELLYGELGASPASG